MRDVLFDADAFLCIRKLSFLSLLASGKGSWVMTGYVARHELSAVASEIDSLSKTGRLRICEVSARDTCFRELKKKGHDKGEAEAIAWAMQLPREQRPIFISVDRRAREGAKENGVPTGDIMELMVEAIACDEVSLEDAREKASIWDDKRQVQGRPNDYTNFDETFKKRRVARGSR